MSLQITVDVGCREQGEIERLAKHVERRLNGRVRGFRLLVRARGLILQGDVATFHAKQLAQHVLMEATRLPILANDIDVAAELGSLPILVDS